MIRLLERRNGGSSPIAEDAAGARYRGGPIASDRRPRWGSGGRGLPPGRREAPILACLASVRNAAARRAACCLAASGLFLGACGESAGRPIRIVLISLDTLRADSLTEERMPATWKLALGGLRFERFYASSATTQPTHASLLTGLHPWQHGVTRNGIVLDEALETVPEILQRHGFETHAVVASFPLTSLFGYAQGFDTYDDEFHEPYVQSWEGQELEDGRFYSLARDVTRAAFTALDGARGERQFFWFHYFDPHDPYGDAPHDEAGGQAHGDLGDTIGIGPLLQLARERDPRIGASVRRARALFERDVQALDQALGNLFERLRADADRFETHILLSSDHGESFGEGGSLGHGKRLTPEQVHVPCVLVSPLASTDEGADAGRGGRSRPDAAGSIDIARTILAIADLGAAAETVGGRDLRRPADGDGAAFGMRRSFAEPRGEVRVDGEVVPVRGQRFFAVREGVLLTGNAEAVFEEDDELRPRAGEGAEELKRLFAVFARVAESRDVEEQLDPAIQEALRKLGYTR